MSKSPTPATPLPERQGYPRSARLRLSREFAFVRKAGRLAQGPLLRMTAAPDPTGGSTRFGVITSRRVGGAVVRNRVRRRLREICRRQRRSLATGWWVVISAKAAAAGAAYADLQDEWLRLARRLSILPRSE